MRRAAAAALLLTLSACTGPALLEGAWPPAAPASVELSGTPFFPQQSYQCGPAALATLLGASGIDTHPEQLVREVYLPDRKGSLQPEIVAAARKRGLVIYPIRPTLTDLLAQLQSGTPVLVLQNLGFERVPVWHYAVVIGADRETGRLLLRSGTTRRLVENARSFERQWGLADYWGIVALQPGRLPADPNWPVYLSAVADLEAAGAIDAAAAAYRAALDVVPDMSGAQFGLANAYYASGRFEEAATLYRQLAADPGFGIAATNNLANLLLDLDCAAAANRVLDATGSDPASGRQDFAAALASTRLRAEEAAAAAPGAACNADWIRRLKRG